MWRKCFWPYRLSMLNFNPKKDYYKILNVGVGASEAQIKKSYHKLAKKYHPDANDGKEEMFKEVNQAYQVLSQASTKRDYDQSRRQETQQQNYTRQSQGPRDQRRQTYRGYQQETGWRNRNNRDDIMDQIFKRQQKMYEQAQRRDEQGPQRGRGERFHENYQFHSRTTQKMYQDYPNIKVNLEDVRRAEEQERKRQQRQYKQFRDKAKTDLEELMKKKLSQMGQGLKQNAEGVVKIGKYLKSFWGSKKKDDK